MRFNEHKSSCKFLSWHYVSILQIIQKLYEVTLLVCKFLFANISFEFSSFRLFRIKLLTMKLLYSGAKISSELDKTPYSSKINEPFLKTLDVQ